MISARGRLLIAPNCGGVRALLASARIHAILVWLTAAALFHGCESCPAATVHFALTNFNITTSTNHFIVTQIDGPVSFPPFLVAGNPIRIPSVNGQATTNLLCGKYQLSIYGYNFNSPLIFTVPCDSSTYEITALLTNGFSMSSTNPPFVRYPLIQGTNVFLTGTGGTMRIDVPSTVVKAGANVTVITNGNEFTVSSSAGGAGAGTDATNISPTIATVGATNDWWWIGSIGTFDYHWIPTNEQRVCLARSSDGISWTQVVSTVYFEPDYRTNTANSTANAAPVAREFAVTVNTNGELYAVWNYDPFTPQPCVGIARSSDGTNWSRVGLVYPFGAQANGLSFGQYAANWYNEGADHYLIFTGSSNGVSSAWISKRLDNTFTNYTQPQQLIPTVDNISYDAMLVKSGSQYQLYSIYAGGVLGAWTNNNLTSLFTLWQDTSGGDYTTMPLRNVIQYYLDENDLISSVALEAPAIVQISPTNWRLYVHEWNTAMTFLDGTPLNRMVYFTSANQGQSWGTANVVKEYDGTGASMSNSMTSFWHGPGIVSMPFAATNHTYTIGTNFGSVRVGAPLLIATNINAETATLSGGLVVDHGYARKMFGANQVYANQFNGGTFTGDGAAVTNGNATTFFHSGTIPTARLGSGTANANTVLLGNQTYGTVPNAGLANSSFTLNGSPLSLGGTRTLGLASSDFANQGTTTTVLHGNASGNPSFAFVNLSTDITGTLGASHIGDLSGSYIANRNGLGTNTTLWADNATGTALTLGGTGNVALLTFTPVGAGATTRSIASNPNGFDALASDIIAHNFKPTNISPSRVVMTASDNLLASASASGAVPIDADGTAATAAQIVALFPSYLVTNNNANLLVQSNKLALDAAHSLSLSNATALSLAGFDGKQQVTNVNGSVIDTAGNVTFGGTITGNGGGVTNLPMLVVGTITGNFGTGQSWHSGAGGVPTVAGSSSTVASFYMPVRGVITNFAWGVETAFGGGTNVTTTLATNGTDSNITKNYNGDGATKFWTSGTTSLTATQGTSIKIHWTAGGTANLGNPIVGWSFTILPY